MVEIFCKSLEFDVFWNFQKSLSFHLIVLHLQAIFCVYTYIILNVTTTTISLKKYVYTHDSGHMLANTNV